MTGHRGPLQGCERNRKRCCAPCGHAAPVSFQRYQAHRKNARGTQTFLPRFGRQIHMAAADQVRASRAGPPPRVYATRGRSAPRSHCLHRGLLQFTPSAFRDRLSITCRHGSGAWRPDTVHFFVAGSLLPREDPKSRSEHFWNADHRAGLRKIYPAGNRKSNSQPGVRMMPRNAAEKRQKTGAQKWPTSASP